MLHPIILGLELRQLVVDPLEGGFRKVPGGKIQVLPVCLPAGSGFWARRRWRWGSGFPEAWCRGSGRLFRNRWVARILRPLVLDYGFRIEFVDDLVRCYGQQVLLLDGEAIVVLVEVKDVGGEEGGFPPDMGRDFSTNS